jgi:predicted acyl esterase
MAGSKRKVPLTLNLTPQQLSNVAKPVMMQNTFTLLWLLIVIPGIQTLNAQLLAPHVDSIPMSDGRKLAADVYIPTGITQGPAILIQTPYNRQLYRAGLPLLIARNINSSNYVIVVVDWRGFYGSAAAAHIGAPSMGADGYSCVEWIAQQSWSNGKVGTWGPSALGRVQWQTAKTNPPHLVCVCPLVAGPQYDYTEYFPHGDLRTEYVEQLDALGFGLKATLMQHPVRDNTWTFVENANFYPDSILVPALMIGGWYDHTIEFMLPFFSAIQNQSPANVRAKHRLLMGPWVHGGHGTAQVGSATQGELSYPNAVDKDDSAALMFFDYYLRGISNGWDATPPVQYYQMGDNIWDSSPAWPPSGASNTSFYFHANQSLDNSPPLSASGSLSFTYDPNNPSPTIGGPTLRADLEQGPYDQAALVESRNDIEMFTTAPLTQDVVMKGQAVVHLKVSSDKYDTDFDIRLTDVYPDGRSMLVNDGVMRLRFRNGNTASDTSDIVPGQVYACDIALPNTSITFLAGHKIRVDVTSSNYPRFNRNMNTDGAMYPGNSLDTLINPLLATNTVYCNNTNASYITLPLVGYVTSIDKVISENDVRLFPNPAGDVLNIFAPEGIYQVLVFNAFGQKMIDTNFKSCRPLDIRNLMPGVYIVEINGVQDESLIRKKIIKN